MANETCVKYVFSLYIDGRDLIRFPSP